jgi:hypothetical protein
MKTIRLACGKLAKVSDEDFERVNALKWSDRGNGYARARYAKSKGGHGGIVYMHRFIMDAPDGIVVDHIDRDPLNNTRENLQATSQARNCMRSAATKVAKGASAHRGKWRARIRVDGKQVSLGVFATMKEAQAAYDAAKVRAWETHAARY